MVALLPIIIILWRWRQEDSKFKVLPAYVVSLRPA